MLAPLKNQFPFSDQDFEVLSGIVTRETGIMLPYEKKNLMYSRLARRLRGLGLNSFQNYIQKINTELKTNNTDELMEMVHAMTTNVTSFFREAHHFKNLEEMLPILHKQFGKVVIWSAAASTGEEPWSIAMTVSEFLKKEPNAQVKIIASDLDESCLETARRGIYDLNPEEVKAHPLLKRYLQKSPDAAQSQKHFTPVVRYNIAPDLKPLIKFYPQNLLKPWSFPEKTFHVVFCRNVIIYFSKDTQRDIFQRMAKNMPTDSVLYIGHSESLMNVSELYTPAGRSTYKRL